MPGGSSWMPYAPQGVKGLDDEQYLVMSGTNHRTSQCPFQPHPITSVPLGPNILSTQFSNDHHNVQNVRLFANCTATLLIQPRLGNFSMPR